MERAQIFVTFLQGLDRRAFAELRRSLAFAPGTYPPAYPYVEPYVARDYERLSFYLLGGLYALHQRPGMVEVTGQSDAPVRGHSLGAAVEKLYAKRDRSPSIQARFIALLDADEEQLSYRLRQVVALLDGAEIPIHWEQLLKDLLAWTHERRYVQQHWARDFYRPTVAAEGPTSAEG